jgi:transcriptional regulator with XRE-family HTH domain
MTNSFGQKIRQMRRVKKLTQTESADVSGVSVRAIQRLEDGDNGARVDTLQALTEALGTTISDLFSDESFLPALDLDLSSLFQKTTARALMV